MKAKFAVLFKNKLPLKLLDLRIPQLKKGQVLVKLHYTSICRSQIMEIDGLRGKDRWLPHLLGHEGSGKIVKLSSNIRNFKINDRVLITWISTEGLKSNGAKFEYKSEIINSGSSTTFSQYTIVSENKIIKLPNYLNYKNASFFGCAIPTGFGMILNEINLRQKNKEILIIGLGGIGVSALICLNILKFKKITVIDNSRRKIGKIKEIRKFKKVNFANNPKEVKINNYDYVIECAGKIETIEKSIDYIKNTGKVIFASHPHSGRKIKINPHELIKGKKIVGTWGGGIQTKKEFTKIFKMMRKNLRYLKIINNQVYDLKDINKAISDFKQNKVLRPIIKL